jgi:hypothetical protein
MRECDTLMCIFSLPNKLEDSQGGSRVRCGFRVIPMRFMLQRYSHIEETHPVKRVVTDIRQTPHYTMEIPWHVGILESTKKTLKRKIWHQRQIWIDCEQPPENAILVLMWLETDEEYNTSVIEYFFLFPTVISTPRYDTWFRSYAILKSAGLLKFLCWADLSILGNLSFWPQTK